MGTGRVTVLGLAHPSHRSRIDMAARHSDDRLEEAMTALAQAVTVMAQKNGNGKNLFLSVVPVVVALAGVFGISYMPRESAGMQSELAKQVLRVERLEKEKEELERQIKVNRQVEDERYRDLEIKLAAKRIISPGITR